MIKLPPKPAYNPMAGAIDTSDGNFKGRLRALGYHLDGPDPQLLAILRQWIPQASSWADCPSTWRSSFLNLLPPKQPDAPAKAEVATISAKAEITSEAEQEKRVYIGPVPEQPIRDYFGWSASPPAAAIDPPPQPEPEPPRPYSRFSDDRPAWTVAAAPRAEPGRRAQPAPGYNRAAQIVHEMVQEGAARRKGGS